MGVRVSINFDNIKSLSAAQMMIRERFASMNNWKTPMKLISMVMYRGIMLNFRTQGSRVVPGGWLPLSDRTKAGRRKGKGSGSPRILQDTGALMLNVNPAATMDEATVTSNMPYSLAMQRGLPARTGNVREYTRADGSTVRAHQTRLPPVPARPFMLLNDEDKKSIDRVALLVIQGKVR